MTASLFDDHEPQDETHKPDPEMSRAVRQLALGGALQMIRAKNVWSVSDAASKASIAPMTWRRMEDGLDVRQRTHVAIDRLLELPFGSVKRALADDFLMVQVLGATGVETSYVSEATAPQFLASFADRTRAVNSRPVREPFWITRLTSNPQQSNSDLEKALAALAHHVPPVAPSNLELATQLVERLTALQPTAAIDDAVHAILKAMPDLIARTCVDAQNDITAEQG